MSSGPAGESAHIRAVYFDAPGVVSLHNETIEPAPGDEIVRSELIGISHGTEMLFYRGPFPSGQAAEALPEIGSGSDYPIKYGYMNVGVTGDGTRVFGFVPHQDVFCAPADRLLRVPDGIDPDDAVLYPSVETALQICHDAAPQMGEVIAVAGLGVIGLLVIELLRRMEVTVIAFDPIASRRERAAAIGAIVLDPNETDVGSRIMEATGNRGADIGINVSAHGPALQTLIDTAAYDGTVVEASWYGDRETALSLGAAFHRRRLTIRASQVSNLNPAMRPRWNRERRTALVWELIRTMRPSKYITHRYPLDNAREAYERIAKQDPDVLQVVLLP